MSYFIATAIKVVDGVIHIKGGSTNVRPRTNEWSTYKDPNNLLKNLICAGLDIRSNSNYAKRVLTAFESVKTKWQERFGERNRNFDGVRHINPYSLYQISSYGEWDNKEQRFKDLYANIEYCTESYREQALKDVQATEVVFEEAVAFYNEQESYFLNFILNQN